MPPFTILLGTASLVQPYVQTKSSLLGYRLKGHSLRGGARAVLLAPTRELALQTHKVVKELSRYTNLRTAVLVGGDSMEAQFAELAANPDIIVATPGACDFLPGVACTINCTLVLCTYCTIKCTLVPCSLCSGMRQPAKSVFAMHCSTESKQELAHTQYGAMVTRA